MTPFMYLSGNSHFHRLDPRYKLIILALVSISVLKAGYISLCVTSLLLIWGIKKTGINIPNAIKHLKLFFILLLFIFTARAVSDESGTLLFRLFQTEVTTGGLSEGGLTAWRFFTVMIAGMIFSRSTKPSEVKSAARWFLKPVPFVPENRAAVMIGLAIRFLPLILNQAQELSLARKARGGDFRKNPVKRMSELSIGLVKKSFRSADHAALAMESRGFTEDRTDTLFSPSRLDAGYLFSAGLLAVFLILY
ncbi:MAG: energy-coupling factor transporter transmembrane component T [Desulfobacteraceae bacterium]